MEETRRAVIERLTTHEELFDVVLGNGRWIVAISPEPPYRLVAYAPNQGWMPAVIGLWSPQQQQILVNSAGAWWSPQQRDGQLLAALSSGLAAIGVRGQRSAEASRLEVGPR
jgi:hypothetical protein